jgi:hypothetical protein
VSVTVQKLRRGLLVLALLLGIAACGDHGPTSPDSPAIVIPPYNRAEWHHWIDEDHDCQDTRAEVLIRDSVRPVTFTSTSGCVVELGQWVDPYGGAVLTDASDVDIDHLVPLENAHYSGGWAWSHAQKEAFANDLSDPMLLLAVDDGLNQQKGGRGPDAWVPPNAAFKCQYVEAWLRIKQRWGLTMTAPERAAVERIAGGC